MPVCVWPFCFNAPCQFTVLFYGILPFGWLCSVMLTPYFVMGILFSVYTHFFWNAARAYNVGWVSLICNYIILKEG